MSLRLGQEVQEVLRAQLIAAPGVDDRAEGGHVAPRAPLPTLRLGVERPHVATETIHERPPHPHPLPPYKHTPLFPLGKDTTTYRKISAEGVRVETIMGRKCWSSRARRCARSRRPRSPTSIICCARRISPRCKRIVEDPEATDNDKFVAFDFLKNANIAAGGVLPMCQDTGTAIIMGKKGRLVWTDGDDEAALAEGARDAYLQEEPALFAARAGLACSRRRTRKSTCRRRSRSMPRAERRLQVPVHRQGRRLGQQGVPVPGDALDPDARPHGGVPEGEGADARHRGVPALSPGDRDRRHLGRADDEDRQARLDQISRQPADARVARTATPSAISRWSRRC